MLALVFSIQGPFVVDSAPIETQSTVLDEFGSGLAHTFFLWSLDYAVFGLLPPYIVPAPTAPAA